MQSATVCVITYLSPMAMSDSDDDFVGTFGGGVGEDHDGDEHDEDEGKNMRRDIKWRMADSFLKRGKSDKDIAAWRERALAAVSEDGSSTTNGRRIVRGDGSVVHELKCSHAYRLGCPWRCRIVETDDHLVLEVRHPLCRCFTIRHHN